jgi:hypothetical protein
MPELSNHGRIPMFALPRKRTSVERSARSALCQKRTHALQQKQSFITPRRVRPIFMLMANVVPFRRQKADVRPIVSRRQSQILFDRIVTDGHVNQRTILKPPTSWLFSTGSTVMRPLLLPSMPVVFRAKCSGGVPVRVQDPFPLSKSYEVP